MARGRKPTGAVPGDGAFWRTKRLSELTATEWESLCDGCGMCCSHKLQDDETGEILLTNVACSLFDARTCRCSDYAHRHRLVPDCVHLTPRNVRSLCRMLPPTCAYRRRAFGRPLPAWHPLVTGDPSSTRRAGMSARDRFLTMKELTKA